MNKKTDGKRIVSRMGMEKGGMWVTVVREINGAGLKKVFTSLQYGKAAGKQ